MAKYRYQCAGRGHKDPAKRCCHSIRLNKPLEHYTEGWRKRLGKCPVCGRPMSRRRKGPKTIERERKHWCNNYPFPHRIGSGCCVDNPNASEEDVRDMLRQRMRKARGDLDW